MYLIAQKSYLSLVIYNAMKKRLHRESETYRIIKWLEKHFPEIKRTGKILTVVGTHSIEFTMTFDTKSFDYLFVASSDKIPIPALEYPIDQILAEIPEKAIFAAIDRFNSNVKGNNMPSDKDMLHFYEIYTHSEK